MSGIAHIMLSVGIMADIGTVGASPAWAVFERVLPVWTLPSIFMAVGLLAFCGTTRVRCLRLSLYLGAPVMWAWAGALMVAWLSMGYSPPMTVPWLVYIGYLKWTVADSGVRIDFLRDSIREITQEARGGKFGHPGSAPVHHERPVGG